MAARIIDVCDALVDAIDDAWTAREAGEEVQRVYIAPVSIDELDSMAGQRQVYVFPIGYTDEPATRGENEWTYQVGIIVVHRYNELPGEPPLEWMDAELLFVQDTVRDAVDFDGRTLLAINTRRIRTETIEIEPYDVEMLNQHSLAWSELLVTLKEITAA